MTTAPSWMSGQVDDTPPAVAFHREMAPSFLDYVCTLNGFAGVPRSGGLRYCELGCRQGNGTALLAAANPDAAFVGIDFNPAHVGEARRFAAAAGIGNVDFIEAGFAEAASSSDPGLAAFDMVALHGVYSRVSADVRASIADFLRARLAPGGIAYVSYDALPGWAALAPLHRLLREYADRTAGDSLRQFAAGRAVLKALVDNSIGFVLQNPMAKRRIELMDAQRPAYLAEEYLDEFRQPLYVTDVIAALAEAGLTYVGSAAVAENRLNLCAPPGLLPVLQSAPDESVRQLLKDYAINSAFRRDVFVKGATRVSGVDLDRRYDATAFALVNRPVTLPESWRVPAGTVRTKPEVVEPLLALLAGGPATGAELRAMARQSGIPDGDLVTMVDILIHNAVVEPCRSDFADIDRAPGQRINKRVLELAMTDDAYRFLAAPVLGSAIRTAYFERLAAPIVIDNVDCGDLEIAGMLFDRVERSGKTIQHNGQQLQRNDQTEANVAAMVRRFRDTSLPRWRQLGVLA